MTQTEAIHAMYQAVVEAFSRAGGAYEHGLPARVFRDVLDALYTGQYYMEIRDNEIQTFCAYWLIHREDVDLAERGARPEDISSGSVLFVVQFFSLLGRQGIATMLKCLRSRCGHVEAALWWRAKPGRAKKRRYFHTHRTLVEGS